MKIKEVVGKFYLYLRGTSIYTKKQLAGLLKCKSLDEIVIFMSNLDWEEDDTNYEILNAIVEEEE